MTAGNAGRQPAVAFVGHLEKASDRTIPSAYGSNRAVEFRIVNSCNCKAELTTTASVDAAYKWKRPGYDREPGLTAASVVTSGAQRPSIAAGQIMVNRKSEQ